MATALDTYAELKTRRRKDSQLKQLEECSRRLAMEGVPSAGRTATKTATLHRKIWSQRIKQISMVEESALEGMVKQAKLEAKIALKEDLRRGAKDYARWL
eukprot:3786535-Pyramimonas_sp.AAC.1